MKLKLMLIFISYFIGVSGEFNEQEENMLTDFLGYLKIKHCIFLNYGTQPSTLKKISASKIFFRLQNVNILPRENFDSPDIMPEPKTMLLQKTTVNFPEIKEYFSAQEEVS